MQPDVRTLIIVIGITHLMQVLVFYHQYKVNRTFQGIGWWLAWSLAEVLGFGAMFLRDIPLLLPLVIIIQNTMIISGTIFLYIGIVRFFNRKPDLKVILATGSVFLFILLYFLFVKDDIRIRSIDITATLAIVSFLTAYQLFINKKPSITASANFNLILFLVHGCIFIYRTVATINGNLSTNIFEPTVFNLMAYFDALVVGLLWTFGLIIMLNQHLNAEMSDARNELQTIFNTSPDAALITRLSDGKIVDINDGFTTITGYARDEIIGKTTLEIKSWKDPAVRQEMVESLNNDGFCENFEAEFLKKDGGVFIGINSAKVIPIQGVPHIISVTRDITERIRNGKKLEASQSLFRSLFENMAEGVGLHELICNEQGEPVDYRILDINFAFEQNTGLRAENVCGLLGSEVYKMNPPPYLKEYSDVVITGKPLFFETYFELFRRHYSISAVSPRPGQFATVFLDITERKQKEEEIRVLNTELEKRVDERTSQLLLANKELEAFSYTVSHDLRAPLRGIDGFTRILMDEYRDKLDEEGNRVCLIIRENTLRMGQLIDNLLAFSRLGRAELQKSPINMKSLIDSVSREIIDDNMKNRVILRTGPICDTYGDITMIRQVMSNLLSNAVKFSAKREIAEITVSCTRDKQNMVYCIQDNGVGFDMKYSDKLFGVFQRLHSVKEFSGTGVGLAIVQRIIHRHEGQVWAESELEIGSKFYFSLPLFHTFDTAKYSPE